MKHLLLNYAPVKIKSPCGKQQQIKPCTDEIVFFAADIEPHKCTAAVIIAKTNIAESICFLLRFMG